MVQPVPGRADNRDQFLERLIQVARERREQRQAEEAQRQQEQQGAQAAQQAPAPEEAPNPNRAGTAEAQRNEDRNPPPARLGIPRDNNNENTIDLFA